MSNGGGKSGYHNGQAGFGNMLGQQRQMTAEEAYRQQSMMQHDPSMIQRQREEAMRQAYAQQQMNDMMRMTGERIVAPVVRKLAKKLIDADRPIREILQEETDDWLKNAV